MLLLDEPHKFKWEIKYQSSKDSEYLISGKCYDFIPSKGDLIIEDSKVYSVTNLIYDFDHQIILVSLAFLQNT